MSIFSHNFIREYLDHFWGRDNEQPFVNYPDHKQSIPIDWESDNDIKKQEKSTILICINCGEIDEDGSHIELPEWRWKCKSKSG